MSDQTPGTERGLAPEDRATSDVLLHAALAGGRLPRWSVAAVAVASVAIALLLNVATPVDGVAGTFVVAVLLFVVIQTAWSFAVEGRRHAIDRLATTAIYATFAIALVPSSPCSPPWSSRACRSSTSSSS